ARSSVAPAAAAGAAAAANAASGAAAAAAPSGSSTPAGGGSSGSTGGGGGGSSTPIHTPPKLPAIHHVWLVVLADQAFHSLYGPGSPAHFLNQALVPQGTLLRRYYATAHGSLADGVALISGQGPTPELQLGCPVFSNLTPGTTDNSGIARGRGCLFPWNPQTFVGVQTLPDLLTEYHLNWKAYVGGQGAVTPPAAPPTGTTTGSGLTLPGGITLPIGSPTTTSTAATPAPAPSATPSTCRHPQLGAADPTAGADTSADGYLTRRNPFVYFHSLIDSTSCAQLDLGLDSLASDLVKGSVPSFSWIAPDLCSAGAADGCPAGTAVTGAAAADAFLSRWIPKIMATSAYRKDGMIVILSDQAPSSGPAADSSACCQNLHYPNSTNPGGSARPGAGGGLTGALVLSRFAAKGGSDTTPSDHYTLLRTIEDIFKITPPLGYALRRQDFTASVFPKESGGSSAVTTSVHHPRRIAILIRRRSAPHR
ncbi:MAG: hypothetical protein M3Z27_02500, partial [Actinomycetota bacterium]|nr:hypothetical protein [Actinomycetota bacterium]